MSLEEQRKHKILQLSTNSLSTTVTHNRMGYGSQPPETEEEEEEDAQPDQTIYDRWKAPIIRCIASYRAYLDDKSNRKTQIITSYGFSRESVIKLSKHAQNIWNITFYKVLSPAGGEKMCSYFLTILGLNSFKFIKFDFNNTCIVFSLNYVDSEKLVQYFNDILIRESWTEVLPKLNSLHLVKEFKVITNTEKNQLNLQIEEDGKYYLFIPNGISVPRDIGDILALFSLNYVEIFNKAEGVYLSVEGDYSKLQDFLLFFEIPEYVFSMEIRTRIFSDENAPAQIHTELQQPTIQETNLSNLPTVFLLDSGLPVDRNIVNPIIRPLILDQKSIPSLEYEHPICDHAVQMSGIISYGEQLHNISEQKYPAFLGTELIPFAKIYSLFMGTDKPKLGIWSLPEIFDQLNNETSVADQLIKIYNISWNIEFPKKDNENISFMSYILDKYLFFHPNTLVVNSVGNYEGDRTGNFFTLPDCNINIPSDCINVLSVGSFSYLEDGRHSIASGNSKNHYDKGVIKNMLKDGIDSWQGIKRLNNKYEKPDLLGLGEKWTSTTQSTNLSLLTENLHSGTSHATAYTSHLSARIIGTYPQIQYATTVEAILLKFLEDMPQQYAIDDTVALNPTIQNRIQEIASKTSFGRNDIIDRENVILHQRLQGRGRLNTSNIFYNPKDTLTFVIEGTIPLGSLEYKSINLLDYLSEDLLLSNTVKFDGFICFRGLSYLQDSIGYNMVNIVSSIRFASDYDNRTNSFTNASKMKWSGNQVCHERMWYPKSDIPAITTGTQLFKNMLIANNWQIDIMVKSIIWRKREREIKEVIKEYFDNLDGNECIGFLQEAYNNFLEHNDINIALVKIPYSIIVSVTVNTDVDIYDSITITEQVNV